MNRLVLLGAAALTALGFAATGCSSDSKASGTSTGGASNGGDTSMGADTGGSATTGTGGTTSTGASTGGATSTAGGAGACGTTNGTFTQTAEFATDLTPYAKNAWGWAATATAPALEQTTTGPTGIDCSGGCAHLTATFADGTAAYSAGVIEQYFGDTTTSVQNLLNETVTIKLAVVVTAASGATAAPPVDVDLTGYDTFTTTTYVDNLWVHNLGTLASLASVTTATYKVVDVGVPSWGVTRTVCASGLHTLGIRVQNSAAITATNAATIDVYIQSIAIAP